MKRSPYHGGNAVRADERIARDAFAAGKDRVRAVEGDAIRACSHCARRKCLEQHMLEVCAMNADAGDADVAAEITEIDDPDGTPRRGPRKNPFNH